jgi:hypothetical protein
MPILIDAAKIRFQKLSLFMWDGVKELPSRFDIIIYRLIAFVSYIVSMLSYIADSFKRIPKTCLIFSIICTVNTAYANDLSSLISKVEKQYDIPQGLLASVARIESNNNPYALSIEGKAFYGKDLEKTLSVLNHHLEKGVRNIDIGVMQINWHWHGRNFSGLDEMITPEYNIKYAAKFLNSLYKRHGSWSKAVRHYHSSNSDRQKLYAKKILISWIG